MADGSLKLVLSYDGAGFAGSQVQPGERTVQGELEGALGVLAGRPVGAVLAGRTDRGVHAAGQVASCPDPRPDWDGGRVRLALNALLPADLAVVAAERRPDGFHARYDARWREYRYRLWRGPRAPLARGRVWEVRAGSDLEVGRMAEAARRLVGERDLAALAGGGEGVPWSDRRARPRGTVRTVLRCEVRRVSPWWGPAAGDGQLLELRVAADGFLPRVVRGIAGLLVEVGRGARPPDWVDEVLAAGDRRAGPPSAPAHGLTLWRVGYGGEEPDDGEDGGAPG